MAAAQQYAPMKQPPQQKAERATAQEKKPDMREKLHRLPMAAGVAALAALLILSLFVGNFRALQNAAPKAFLRQGDVQSIIADRVAQAGNAQATHAGCNHGGLNVIFFSIGLDGFQKISAPA